MAAIAKLTTSRAQTDSFPSTLQRYGGATAIALAALAVRMTVASWHSPVHLIFYYAPIAASVWLFDFGPALLALAICFIPAMLNLPLFRVVGIYFVGPDLGLVLSITVNFAIILIVAQLKATERRLRSALVEMEGLRRSAEASRQAAERDREIAERANRDKAEYLATISHELRTPLNSMVLSAAALRRGALDNPTRWLDRIDNAAFALTRMVERLLEFARIENRRLELVRRSFNLAEVVRNEIELIRPAAESRGIQLCINIAGGEDAAIDGDAERIQDGIANLLSNAIKFTPEGGRIQVELSDFGDSAQFRVSDTGVGIAPEFLPRVFERFAQDGGSLRVNPGLGLGLFIVKHVVELHGGSITAESAGIGKGAIFTMTLPKSPPETIAKSLAS
ncbi:MAG TPA: HAMP domain-containing sensor histidine kinase [Candidatus Binataceae bacterium]|nr:HAMP domain-containing sensor histidine kinase [Candidatus Binataceae bacterium]